MKNLLSDCLRKIKRRDTTLLGDLYRDHQEKNLTLHDSKRSHNNHTEAEQRDARQFELGFPLSTCRSGVRLCTSGQGRPSASLVWALARAKQLEENTWIFQ